MGQRVVLAILATSVLAACGSSNKANTSSFHNAALAFGKCMRAHGVPAFPDPSTAGGGIKIGSNSGINPFSPAFQSAQASCRKLLPGGGPPRVASAQDKARMLQTSQCMRQHGITGFPDPTTTPPTNPAAYSSILGRGGVFLAIPKTIDPQSPAFIQAATACGFPH
jgi:hypothetical protein